MNEIIKVEDLSIATGYKFKSKALENSTNRICSIVTNAIKYVDAKNREIATILAEVKTKELYKEDGFASVADYAGKIFGVKKNNAYMLASAGEIYNDPNASPALKSFSPSKLAEVSTVDRKKLEDDIKAGTITAETTQKELREYKDKSTQKTDKVVVLDQYTAKPYHISTIDMAFIELLNKSIYTMDEWDKVIREQINMADPDGVEVISLPKGPSIVAGKPTKKKTVIRRLYISGDTAITFQFFTHTPAKVEPIKKVDYTIEQLEAMLEAARAQAGGK